MTARDDYPFDDLFGLNASQHRQLRAMLDEIDRLRAQVGVLRNDIDVMAVDDGQYDPRCDFDCDGCRDDDDDLPPVELRFRQGGIADSSPPPTPRLPPRSFKAGTVPIAASELPPASFTRIEQRHDVFAAQQMFDSREIGLHGERLNKIRERADRTTEQVNALHETMARLEEGHLIHITAISGVQLRLDVLEDRADRWDADVKAEVESRMEPIRVQVLDGAESANRRMDFLAVRVDNLQDWAGRTTGQINEIINPTTRSTT